MSMALLFDLGFLLILFTSILLAAKKGAFKAISGIAGTLAGLIAAVLLKDAVSPFAESFLSPLVRNTVSRWDIPQLAAGEQTSAFFEKFSELIQSWQTAGEQAGAAKESLVAAISGEISLHLSAILSFLLVFLVVKLAVTVICHLLNDDIPIIRTLSKGLGALLGALSGALLILVLCLAILRFAPDDGVSFLNQQALRDSTIGGVVCELFE